MESGFQTGWTTVDTGKSSGWLAGRSFCCQNVGNVLPDFSRSLTTLQVCPPLDSFWYSAVCYTIIQLEIQRKGRPFAYFANILIILRTRICAKFSRNRFPDSFSSFILLCFESFCQAGKCVLQQTVKTGPYLI